MPKKINYQLNDIELQTIKAAMTKAPEPEVRLRATAIHLLHLGHSPTQVAEMLSMKVGSIYNWYRRWREAGLEGLANQPKSGRRRKAAERYCQHLEAAVETDPQNLGYEFTIWTAQRLIEHLYQTTGKRLSVSHLRSLLKQRDFVYRRPKHDLKPLQEPQARQEALELIEALKKSPSRRDPPLLCGGNDLRLTSGPAGLLDAAASTKAHPCRGSTAMAARLGRLQLGR